MVKATEFRHKAGKRFRRANWLGQLPRLIIVGVALLCLILGYWGFVIYARTPHFPEDWQTGRLNFLYYTLQLFVGASGPVGGTADMAQVPWQLNVARLLAPASAVIGGIVALLAIFDEQIRRAYRRSRRGHIIIVGDTPDAEVIEDALRSEDAVVEQAASGSRDDLIQAGAHGAAAIYICNDDTGDPGANLRVAATIRSIKPKVRHRKVAVALCDPELAPAMLARHLTHPVDDVDLFSLTNLAASRLAAHILKQLRQAAAHNPLGQPSEVTQIWLLGSGRLHDEVIYEVVQEWAVSKGVSERLEIVASGKNAQKVLDSVCARLPKSLLDVVKLTADDDVSQIAPTDLTVVCGKNDAETLELALETPKAWQGAPGSLIVQVTHGEQAEALFGEGVGLLGGVDGVLDVVTTASLILPLKGGLLVHESSLDRLQHVAYRTNSQHGYQSGAALPQLLAGVERAGWKVVPFGASVGLELPAAAVTSLASGYYEAGSNGVPFAQLQPAQAAGYRQQVAVLPETLAQMGLGIAEVNQSGGVSLISSATPLITRATPLVSHATPQVARGVTPMVSKATPQILDDGQRLVSKATPKGSDAVAPLVTKATPQAPDAATTQISTATPKAAGAPNPQLTTSATPRVEFTGDR